MSKGAEALKKNNNNPACYEKLALNTNARQRLAFSSIWAEFLQWKHRVTFRRLTGLTLNRGMRANQRRKRFSRSVDAINMITATKRSICCPRYDHSVEIHQIRTKQVTEILVTMVKSCWFDVSLCTELYWCKTNKNCATHDQCEKHFTCWRVSSFQQRSLLRSGLWELLHHFFFFFCSKLSGEKHRNQKTLLPTPTLMFLCSHTHDVLWDCRKCAVTETPILCFCFFSFTDAENWVKVKQDSVSHIGHKSVFVFSIVQSFTVQL